MSFRDDILGSDGGTAGVTSLNGLTGALTLKSGSGISITPSGSSINIAYTGGGSVGLTSVTHDGSLTGAGTGASPLAIANGQVVRSLNGLHDDLTLAAGSNVTLTPSGNTLTIASTAGLTLPFTGVTGSPEAFQARTTGEPGVSLAIGVEGNSASSTAGSIGVFGEAGSVSSFPKPSGPAGVYGIGSTFGVSGYSSGGDGVFGRSSSGYAVHGFAGTGTGLYGTSASGYGVYGTASGGIAAVAGYDSGGAPGLYGESVTGSGLYATSASGYAGYFGGDMHVNGTLSKSGGSFKIDDPLDPVNKYLSHSFVESPDMMNIYNGIAMLGPSGTAEVSLPDWFEALNRDFRYQLTAIGTPQPGLFISEEIHANVFRVAGGVPGARVSWQVTGIRHDPWADAHRIPVEEAKPEDERGLYLHPELYDQPKSKSADPFQRAGARERQE